ncbi:histidine kinase [Flavobacterium aciduliphilum]|uniref:Histidine kinase/DNA gyrase B/HSP90-like ATPase n=1 Tax=Flavobacterium aciduliphilum TaxID=1101402 RepID=A0A328YNM2_9FLAO|nr:HAMP domain-containing histidine kinase [Flavobacterium aciduliphilum]RAR75688.1 hypothetical protein CLV55_101388 [Flavobacterium aciduliphilum]
MSDILTCYNCHSKPCKQTKNDTFDICQYGVSFVNRHGNIEKKEPKIPLSTIAKNLRHEINPILQSIIEQATILDPNLSTKIISLDKPLSIIIGNTVILDNFIQMITGVHEFHSTPSNISQKPINLKNVIEYYFGIYSIIKENDRAENITLNNLINRDYTIEFYSDFIKYIIVILIDNIWKYSTNNSTVTISVVNKKKDSYNIEFTNQSNYIPNNINLFEMGSKVNENSKGFGFGLYWIKTLEDSYNNLIQNTTENRLLISHEQILTKKNTAFQKFKIENINLKINSL